MRKSAVWASPARDATLSDPNLTSMAGYEHVKMKQSEIMKFKRNIERYMALHYLHNDTDLALSAIIVGDSKEV